MNSNLIKLVFVVSFVILFLHKYNISLRLNLKLKSRSNAAIQLEQTSTGKKTNTPKHNVDHLIDVEKTNDYLNLNITPKIFNKKLRAFISTYKISTESLDLKMPLQTIFLKLNTFARIIFFRTSTVHRGEIIYDLMQNAAIFADTSDFLTQQGCILSILNFINEWTKIHPIDEEVLDKIKNMPDFK